MLANLPARPQDNGVVERSQGTAKRWAEPHQANSVAELNAQLQVMDKRQRESYPYGRTASRLAAYPKLAHSGRLYEEALEPALWSLERVYELLADFVVRREIDGSGMVSVYNQNYYVSQAHRGESIWVEFDPQQQSWQFRDRSSGLLKLRAAEQLSRERIVILEVTNRRDRAAGTAGKPRAAIAAG